MTGTSTLYPFELFRLLEALWEDRFAGSVALRALDETTTLYLVDGQVRYATTTDVTGSFPGYLLTERIFSRDEIHGWLKRCGEEQRTLEDLLLSDGILDAAAAVALKADLGSSVFATAFALSASAEVVPSHGTPPIFGDVVLNPFDGLFQCAAEGHAIPQLVTELDNRATLAVNRGPTFFRLWPVFKRWFDSSPLLTLLDTGEPIGSMDASSEEWMRLLTHAFLMCETGMAHFVGEAPRSGVMTQVRRTLPSKGSPPPPPPRPAPLRRGPTEPGLPSAGQKLDPPLQDQAPDVSPAAIPLAESALAPPPPSNPEHRVASLTFADEEIPWTDPSESFADLRGSLVGADLTAAAERARKLDCYAFLGVVPVAPLSEIRAAWQTMCRRYEDERYQGLMLRTAAAKALRELQKRTEAAYDTLTDLRRRQDHDARFGIQDGLNRQLLEDVFYAEGLFKAAQIRLTEEQHAEATELLDEAFIRNPTEPEYLSYLAFTVFTGRLAEADLGPVDEEPEALVERALAMNPKLESAWLFRARMMDHAGHASRAMGAYLTVLDINASNDEARIAVRAFREAGILPAGRLRRGLAQRMARLIGARGDR